MPGDPIQQPGLPIILRCVLAAIGALLAAWLLWVGVHVHLERACTLMDTPYLPLCTQAESETGAERMLTLRRYLAENPGDSSAWIQLASLETGLDSPAVLRAAFKLAPTDPNVMLWRAGAALRNNDLEGSTALLVQLVMYRHREEAAHALARIVTSGGGQFLQMNHLPTAGQWLPQVFVSTRALKLPLSPVLPLVAQASAQGGIPQSTLREFIRALKADRNWGDAYGLWVSQLKGPVPLLTNASFDARFQPDAFDWEVASAPAGRAGALVSQREISKRGQVLDIQFTGRQLPIPIIRQYVFMPPGKYVLRGEYMASKLRMEQGLAWVVRCPDSKPGSLPVARSQGLLDTAGRWQSFQIDLAIPADCVPVVSLQLETFAPFEAATGAKGNVAFDAFRLEAARL